MSPRHALSDMFQLVTGLGAVEASESPGGHMHFRINLDWPTQITEAEFIERLKKLPKSQTYFGFSP